MLRRFPPEKPTRGPRNASRVPALSQCRDFGTQAGVLNMLATILKDPRSIAGTSPMPTTCAKTGCFLGSVNEAHASAMRLKLNHSARGDHGLAREQCWEGRRARGRSI